MRPACRLGLFRRPMIEWQMIRATGQTKNWNFSIILLIFKDFFNLYFSKLLTFKSTVLKYHENSNRTFTIIRIFMTCRATVWISHKTLCPSFFCELFNIDSSREARLNLEKWNYRKSGGLPYETIIAD